MSYTMKEVDYLCTTKDCEHRQTVRYFPDEPVNPVLCCVKCRAGFGVEHRDMVMRREGMVIVGKPRMDSGESKLRRQGAFTSTGVIA